MSDMPKRSGIIWDLDHTLYESPTAMHEAWTEAFYIAACKQGFTHSRDEVAVFVREKHQQYGNTIRFYSQELGADEKQFYQDMMDAVDIPHLPQCLRTQEALGFFSADRMAILTSANRSWACTILDRIGLRPLFSDARIVSLDETGGLLKSQSPVPFEMAARAVGYVPKDLIMVDDTPVNLRIAKDLGMATVLVTHGAAADSAAHIDFVVNKAYDVFDLINQGHISWASVSHS